MTRAALFALGLALLIAACGKQEPAVHGNRPELRLLTEEQYRNVIGDVFGPQIVIGDAPDPIMREEALIAASAGHATVSPAGLAKYAALADSIAAQVVNPANRKVLIGCRPASATAADDTCARASLARTGRLLFRRPLSEAELTSAAATANKAAATLNDFYAGLAYGLSALLVSPNFLFIVDTVEPHDATLTPYAKAARLSFFLWNTTPDEPLLDAAAKGELDTPRGVARTVDRLMRSPRLGNGVRAFFADMLELDKFGRLAKDTQIYPAFDPEVTQDAREQMLRTVSDALIDRDGDYRDIFKIRTTFMTPALGRIYRVPVAAAAGWSRYDFPKDDLRVGIQTLAGFAALHSHPGRSSPTIRGRAVRELLLCQKVPDPPGDVDFSLFNQPSAANLPARERLKIHSTNPTCAGCHKLTDPIGLSLENFDGAAQYRAQDAGAAIDASGALDGQSFADPQGLAEALAANPSVPSCLVQRLASYALAGTATTSNPAWTNFLSERFKQEGYRLKPLLRAIATSPNFTAVELPPDRPSEEPRA